MSELKTLYKTYFQKSRVFLYPLLEIRRGTKFTPLRTYVRWEGHYETTDMKLCATYKLHDSQEYVTFDKSMLTGNRLYHDFKQVGDDVGVYVFDLSTYEEGWNHFINGKYSQFRNTHKRRVLNWIGSKDTNYGHVKSFLYPEEYFGIYADLLKMNEYHIRKVGELCDPPNLEEETLKINVISLDIVKKI